MKNIFFFFACFPLFIIAQVTFEKYSWEGNLAHYSWQNNTIELNADQAGKSILSSPISWTPTSVFSIHLDVNFAPSLNNSIAFILSSDSIYNPNGTHNLEIKLGQTGNQDAFDLFYNQSFLVKDSLRLWGNGGKGTISIIQNHDSIQFLSYKDNHNPRVFKKVIGFTSYKFFHIVTKYTQSNRNNIKMDNLFIGIPQLDSFPPILKEINLSNEKIIQLKWDEAILNKPINISPQPDSLIITNNTLLLYYESVTQDFYCSIHDSIFDLKNNSTYLDTSFLINKIQQFDLLISEVYPNPNHSPSNLNSEFIEIQNKSQFDLIINDLQLLVNNKTEALPDTVLKPNQYIVHYPKSALINSGCSIQLTKDNQIIHSMQYNLDTYADDFKANGGWSLELQNTDYPCVLNNWKACKNSKGATPLADNSTQFEPLLFDELTITSVFPKSDSIISIYFSNPIDCKPFQQELFKIEGLNIISYQLEYDHIMLQTSPMDSSVIYQLELIGNIESCTGELHLYKKLEFGLPKTAKEGDIIFNEILFNPDQLGSDFIEIKNISDHFVNLKNLTFASYDSNLNLSDFSPLSNIDISIGPNEIICFSNDPKWLQSQFYTTGKIIQSQIPACNNDEDHVILLNQFGESLQSLSYSEDWHYPELNTLENVSLAKISPNHINEQNNWYSSASSNNYGTPGLPNGYEKTKDIAILSTDVITPNNDGVDDFLILDLNFNQPGWTGTIEIFNSEGITIHTLIKNQLFGTNPIHWNMQNTEGDIIKPGVYILFFQGVHIESGRRRDEKITFYVNRKI